MHADAMQTCNSLYIYQQTQKVKVAPCMLTPLACSHSSLALMGGHAKVEWSLLAVISANWGGASACIRCRV